MALIKCPECNHDVSTMAVACPNCGYPVQQQNNRNGICKINSKEYDFSEELKLVKNDIILAVAGIRKKTGMCLADGKALCDEMRRIGKVPSEFNPSTATQPSMQNTNNQPKCPTCGSTNLETLGAGTRAAASVMFGLASKTARSQFVCKNCGYKW